MVWICLQKIIQEQVGSKLGEQFFRQMMTAIIFIFIFMSIVVLFTFRTLAPSFSSYLRKFRYDNNARNNLSDGSKTKHGRIGAF